MSQRDVALNSNWRHGDMLCSSCNTAGHHDVLKPNVCGTCKKATCYACRGGTDGQVDHAHAQWCRPASAGRKRR